MQVAQWKGLERRSSGVHSDDTTLQISPIALIHCVINILKICVCIFTYQIKTFSFILRFFLSVSLLCFLNFNIVFFCNSFCLLGGFWLKNHFSILARNLLVSASAKRSTRSVWVCSIAADMAAIAVWGNTLQYSGFRPWQMPLVSTAAGLGGRWVEKTGRDSPRVS